MVKTRKRIETTDQLMDELCNPGTTEDSRPWEQQPEPDRNPQWVPGFLISLLIWSAIVWITVLTFNAWNF